MGLAAGLELASMEALWNDYPALGFWRTALLTARPLVISCEAAGLGAGVMLAIVIRVWRRLAGISPLVSVPRIAIGLAGAFIAIVLISGWLLIAGVSTAFVVPAAGGTAAALLLSAAGLMRFGAAGSRLETAPVWLGLALLVLEYAAVRFVYLRFFQRGDEIGLAGAMVLVLGTGLVIGIACLLARSRAGGGRVSEVLMALAIAIPASLWLAAGPPPGRRGISGPRPNVLLIGIDTLRLDRTVGGEDGPGARPMTPRLASYARDGVVFTHAISQAPWTLPAFASIMTGLYPFEHGADSLLGSLPRSRVTLAELLCEAGYSTGAVVSHHYVARKVGLMQGFEVVDEGNKKGPRGESSTGVTDDSLAFIDSVRERPFFLFSHYFDPHYEYEGHEEIDAADNYHGWLDGVRDILALRLMRHLMSPADVEHLRDLYDEEVAHTDAQIGRLLDGLKERGLYRNTAIIIVSDHGEELMERGWLGHTVTLHDEVVRVPLIVILPGTAPPEPSYQGTVETRAIFATVLDHLGVERTAGGSNLLAAFGRRTEPPAGAFSAVWMPDVNIQSGKRVRMASYSTDRWKLIIDLDRGSELLYDVRSDPLESLDRAASSPEALASMRTVLKDWLGRMLALDRSGETGTSTQEEMEMLRSLGYM